MSHENRLEMDRALCTSLCLECFSGHRARFSLGSKNSFKLFWVPCTPATGITCHLATLTTKLGDAVLHRFHHTHFLDHMSSSYVYYHSKLGNAVLHHFHHQSFGNLVVVLDTFKLEN